MTLIERLIARLGVDGVARRFGVHPQTVRRWRREGLPGFRKPRVQSLVEKVPLPKKRKKAKAKVRARKPKPKPVAPVKKPKVKRPKKPKYAEILPPEAVAPEFPPVTTPRAIVTTAEIMAERLNRHYRAYIEQSPFNYGVTSASGRPYGQAFPIQRGGRDGLILTQYVNLRVTRFTVKRIIRAVLADAESMLNALPGGEVRVTFALFEYGSQFAGQSPSSTAFSDDEGTLVTSYLSTRGHYNLDKLGETLNTELNRLARHERSAIKIESYTVRIYR